MSNLIINDVVYVGVGTFVNPLEQEVLRLELHEAVQAAFVLVALFVFYTV